MTTLLVCEEGGGWDVTALLVCEEGGGGGSNHLASV